MKRIIYYKLESDDPSLVYVHEAFNRLPMSQLTETESKAENSIRHGCFRHSDVLIICDALRAAANRGRDSASRQSAEIAESIIQAATNAEEAANSLWTWFNDST